MHKHDKLREARYESGPCFSLSFEEGDEHSRDKNLIETEEEYFINTCNYWGEIFKDGKTLESHMICNHQVPEDCSACYRCGEEFSEDLGLGCFEVLWDEGSSRRMCCLHDLSRDDP